MWPQGPQGIRRPAACELPKVMCCVTFTLYVASRREACRLTARRLGVGGGGSEGPGGGDRPPRATPLAAPADIFSEHLSDAFLNRF